MDESWSSPSYLVEASSFHNSVGLLNGHTVAILHCYQRAERSRGWISILVKELNLLYKQLSQIQHGIKMLFSIVEQEEYIC